MNFDWQTIRNITLKALALLIALNLLFAALVRVPAELSFSFYNRLYPGRARFPFGETAQAYNLSIFDLRAMFAAHEIDGSPKPADEVRVLLVGDSSVWGTLLEPDETLAGQLNALSLRCGDKRIRVYNLGYPTISLLKDLMVLSEAGRYQPDLIVWLTTLEALPRDKQLLSPVVANNPARIRALNEQYRLDIDPADPQFVAPSFWGKTIVGQRRALADWFRLQGYGVMWAATGVDQVYPPYEPAQTDFDTDVTFHGQPGPNLDQTSLSFDVLEAGLQAAGDTPVLLVNEPMLVSSGQNSDLRYNFFYPRWAYDQYRALMSARTQAGNWNYLDLWNILPADEFTNSAIHLTPAGEAILAAYVSEALLPLACP